MFSLDPEKLFIVLIVALVLLGPDKLPRLARQLGAGWARFRAFQQKMEEEVRETVPNLPSSQELARIARSPLAYLTSMAATDDGLVPDAGAVPPGIPQDFPLDPAAAPASAADGNGTGEHTLVRLAGVPVHQLPADPGMN